MAADYKTLYGIAKDLAAAGDTHFDPTELIARAREAVKPTPPRNDVTIVHRIPEEDPCCGPSLRAAAKRGHLDNGLAFTCGKCGTNWKAKRTENVVEWQPESNVMVFKGAQ